MQSSWTKVWGYYYLLFIILQIILWSLSSLSKLWMSLRASTLRWELERWLLRGSWVPSFASSSMCPSRSARKPTKKPRNPHSNSGCGFRKRRELPSLELSAALFATWSKESLSDTNSRWSLLTPISPSLSTSLKTAEYKSLYTGRWNQELFGFQDEQAYWRTWGCIDYQAWVREEQSDNPGHQPSGCLSSLCQNSAINCDSR